MAQIDNAEYWERDAERTSAKRDIDDERRQRALDYCPSEERPLVKTDAERAEEWWTEYLASIEEDPC